MQVFLWTKSFSGVTCCSLQLLSSPPWDILIYRIFYLVFTKCVYTYIHKSPFKRQPHILRALNMQQCRSLDEIKATDCEDLRNKVISATSVFPLEMEQDIACLGIHSCWQNSELTRILKLKKYLSIYIFIHTHTNSCKTNPVTQRVFLWLLFDFTKVIFTILILRLYTSSAVLLGHNSFKDIPHKHSSLP